MKDGKGKRYKKEKLIANASWKFLYLIKWFKLTISWSLRAWGGMKLKIRSLNEIGIAWLSFSGSTF